MSVSSHDVLPGFPGQLLQIDAPAADVSDPTEDLGEEITSELVQAASAQPPARAARTGGDSAAGDSGVQSAPGNVLRERYILETPLGNGGTAMVFRAVDLRRDGGAPDGRHVAIKLLRPELRDRPASIARLQREFRQTQAAAHPNVVRFHDLDCDRGTWFIVMELLSGETLGPRLRRAAPAGLPPADALSVAAAVGDALIQAHLRGVTHGDVKPDNIFVTASGPVRLLDFGVAPETPASAAAAGIDAMPAAAATRAYASPEVLAGEEPSPADDVFSLACVTYEMLAGAHPFRRQSGAVAARTAAPPPPIASLDPAIAAALSAALELKRAARPTMPAFVAALRGEMKSAAAPSLVLPVPAAVPTVEPPLPVVAGSREARRPRALLWGLVAAAIVTALALGVVIGRGKPDAAPATTPPAPSSIEAVAPAAPSSETVLPTTTASEPPAAPATVTAEMAAPARDAAQPGLVSFDSPMMIVSERAVVAAIPLRHFSRVRRSVQVTWRLVDGTARAGRDYGGPTTGVENFVEGNTFRILYVPILPDARTMLDRNFAVELTGASPGTEVGPTERIEVMILGTA